MDIITTDDLAAYLDVEPATTDGGRGRLVVALTNALITEQWVAPVDPAPASVQLIAYAVAARAWAANPGQGPIESITRSFDDSSRTERFAVPAGDPNGHGVYLTGDELAILNPVIVKRAKSIRLSVPGYGPGSRWP